MVAGIPLIEAVADALAKVKPPAIVLDPVMISKSGYALLKKDAQQALVERLFPLATVVTPNIHEAGVLVKSQILTLEQMKTAARKMLDLGARNAVIKGGHLEDTEAIDVFFDGRTFEMLRGQRITTRNTHGTGCTFSSAIAAHLAKGHNPLEAVRLAKTYIGGAIAHALGIGRGHGPTHHFYDLYQKAGMEK
jgi:hydroxymethylpyrimidine/phosphomethylpyrimidine kinase